MKADLGRTETLYQMLNQERIAALARVRECRAVEEQEDLSSPGDELDFARALEDTQTHAALVERAEERLRALDSAFALLERSRYGECAECGDEIPLERLKLLPFATLCVECQQEQNRARNRGQSFDEPVHRAQFQGKIDDPADASGAQSTSSEVEELAQEMPSIRSLSRNGAARAARPRRTPLKYASR